MITAIKWGAMYGMLDDGDEIRPEVVQLGDRLIIPGDRITRIGSKDRSSFHMQGGFWLEYAGRVDNALLFTSGPSGVDGNPWYYAFFYVDPETLLIGGGTGCMDIRADRIDFAS
ncbi:MAG: hypothetical protein C6W55_00080 [Thermobacillus sp.]|uniref:hypothetical protein n=1 Tax=Thermobacillus sp. TaxID=2108467 RepID=UPI000E39FB04|nr:hypothetical protein [Thermobacillus sp.]REK60130.1 MAG: hypothetical protein C6W55_00080 [Thermobacillus sp.]